MSPYGGLANSLPVLNKFFQWFMVDHLKVEGGLFRIHQKATSFLLLLGFCFISVENYLGSKDIQCHGQTRIIEYAKQYCWIHGYAYIDQHLQGRASGCYVDQRGLTSREDGPVTTYYLWLPYMMSLLFIVTKLPHIMWKRFLENNLIRHLLGGEESWQELFIGPKNGGGGGGGGDGNDNGKKGDNNNNNNNNNQESKKNKKKGNQGNQGKRFKVWKNIEIGKNFAENRKKFTKYQFKYALCETLNILSILASIQITDWVLNSQFWKYGLNVIHYLNVYQDWDNTLHDPMCQVFPTEVSCRIVFGSEAGHADEKNYLCILGNNIFNQKYFFALWLWWMILLAFSVLGLIFRMLRLASPLFSKLVLLRKVHGHQLSGLILTSGECFVLELLIDNLTNVPIFTESVLSEIAANMKEVSYRRLSSKNYRDDLYLDLNDGIAPLLRNEEIDPGYYNHSLSPSKNGNVKESPKEITSCRNDQEITDNNDGDIFKAEPESSAAPSEFKKPDGGNNGQDCLVEVNEITKSTSKKKKNKKNANVKAPADSQEVKNLPSGSEEKMLQPSSGQVNVEDSENDGSRISEMDQTVVSFPANLKSERDDWL